MSENDFIKSASVPRDLLHTLGDTEGADALLRDDPMIASANIYAAAVLGDAAIVDSFVKRDPSLATAKGGPYEWEPLTYLCFSRYLKLDKTRTDDFVRAARILLDAGANPNGGWFEKDHDPSSTWESHLYGVAGIAHNPVLTKLLLDYGADPNDDETPYHTPESYDNEAMQVLVESGKMNPHNLSMMLIRKLDWHDTDGVRYLLEHGVHPDRKRWRAFSPLHHALQRDNSLEIIKLLLDHGAKPGLVDRHGVTGFGMAARMGRGDVLEELRNRGFSIDLKGLEALLAACALGDDVAARQFATVDPGVLERLIEDGGDPMMRFAGTGNEKGLTILLDLGVPVDSRSNGDGYWGLVKDTTALITAAWRAQHDVVKLLIARGANVNLPDGDNRTPLMMAVKACVDSYWMRRRSTESIKALLHAGALKEGVRVPTGYPEADQLLS